MLLAPLALVANFWEKLADGFCKEMRLQETCAVCFLQRVRHIVLSRS